MLEKIKLLYYTWKARRKIKRESKTHRISPYGREFLYYMIDKYLNGNEREPIEDFENALTKRIALNDNNPPKLARAAEVYSLFKTDQEKRSFASLQYVTFMIAAIPSQDRPVILNLIKDYRMREMIMRSIP